MSLRGNYLMNTNTTYQLCATYNPQSYWELDFNLNDCADWYIRWDTLFVQFSNGQDYVEYEPILDVNNDIDSFKHPINVHISSLNPN